MSIKITTRNSYVPHLLEVDRIVQTTRNLFDKDAEPYINDAYIKWDGSTTLATGFAVYKIPITKGTYTITHTSMVYAPGYVIYDSNDNIISGDAYSGRGVFTFDAPDNSDYILVSVVYDVDGADAYRRDIDFFQLELGSEATPYVPHLIEITEIIQKTRNLTDTVVGERFSSATGNILGAANAVRTDLVPVEANKPYTVSGLDSGSSFIEIFDSNKQPIARTGAKAWGTFTFEWDYTNFITLFKSEISDVGYIAACNYNLTDPNSVKLQIEAGTEATEYIPPMVKLFKAE